MKGSTSIDSYIFPNKILCEMIGMWPMREIHKTFFNVRVLFVYFRALFTITAVSGLFVPELMAIAVNWGDIAVLTGVGCVCTTLGPLLFKMIYFSLRRERMSKLYEEVIAVWESPETPEERQPMEQLAYWAKTATIGFTAVGIINVITFTTPAFVDFVTMYHIVSNNTNNIRRFPFEVWYGKDVSESPNYEIALGCQTLTSFICCAALCGLDTTFMTIILHACGQFKFIKTRIRNIGARIKYESRHDHLSPTLKREIDKCIRHHQRMIGLVTEINVLLSPIMFVQLLTSGLEICLSGYGVLFNGATGMVLMKFVSYLFAMLVQLVMWCWPAEILIEESQQLGEATYFDVPWYMLPPPYRRQLYLIIMRAQRNCEITALTFQTLSIRTLTNVFKTAGSFFTLLRGMQYD